MQNRIIPFSLWLSIAISVVLILFTCSLNAQEKKPLEREGYLKKGISISSNGSNEGIEYTTEQPSVAFTAASAEGEWNFRLKASEEAKASTWLDLNGNATYDSGEELTDLILKEGWKAPKAGNKVTLYGVISELYCNENNLVAISLSASSALETLDCSNNQLTKLDLKELPNLSILLCSENKLEALDVSKNPNLTKLWCSKNREIKTLDLSTNTELMALWCYGCDLSTLDLSPCTSLTGVDCYSNKLTSLTLGAKDYLTRISCFDNQLETLDLQGVPNLDELNCSSNKLASLSLAKTPYLTSLNCANNRLTSLDLTAVPFLESLYCHKNELTALDLTKNKSIEVLYCYENKIEGKAMDDMVSSMRKVPKQNYQNLMIINTSAPTEKNFPTVAHVATLQQKGWTPKDFQNGANKGEGVPFAGLTAMAKAAHGESLLVLAKEGFLSIEGTPLATLTIYTLDGKLLHSEKLSESGESIVAISTEVKAVIVAVGEYCQKVVLR